MQLSEIIRSDLDFQNWLKILIHLEKYEMYFVAFFKFRKLIIFLNIRNVSNFELRIFNIIYLLYNIIIEVHCVSQMINRSANTFRIPNQLS